MVILIPNMKIHVFMKISLIYKFQDRIFFKIHQQFRFICHAATITMLNTKEHSAALKNVIVKCHKNGEGYDKIANEYHLPKLTVHVIYCSEAGLEWSP